MTSFKVKSMCKIYAIRISDHIEFRIASNPPRAKTSKLSWPGNKTLRTTWENGGNYGYESRSISATLTLKQTFYVGGRVIKVCKVTQANRLGLKLKADEMREVTREIYRMVKT